MYSKCIALCHSVMILISRNLMLLFGMWSDILRIMYFPKNNLLTLSAWTWHYICESHKMSGSVYTQITIRHTNLRQPPCHHRFWIRATANRNQIKPEKEQHTQLQHPLLQDTVQTDVILPPDHPWMEQPAPGNSGSQVPGLFQVQACCPPVTRQTTPPLPPPLLFLMSTTPLYYATHPFTTFQKCLLQPPRISIIITTLILAD